MTQPTYALVTGASKGLGKAFALELAARKRNLVLTARSREKLETLADEFRRREGVLVETAVCDLASRSGGEDLAEQLKGRNLRINLLINNAGFGERGEFRNLSLERQLEMVRLNNQAVLGLTFQLLPGLVELRGGIINVASTAGFQAIPYAAVYAATKSFMITFSLAIEQELRACGVRVVTLCPGRIRADPQENRASGKIFRGMYQSAARVVRKALRKLEGGGGLVVPGILNGFGASAAHLIPASILPRLVAKLSRP